jgi:AdoMet-dependent rRNA methyltransferase SPB1
MPAWFKADEDKHFRKPVQVPENLVTEYDGKLADINVRTCKKVAEAKARKKRKAMKVMEKLKKKTEAITENNEMTEREKVANIKRYEFFVSFS